MRVVVIGSSNTDLVIQTPRLPHPGETIGGGEFHQFAGGKGANQAVAAARAGMEVALVGARGKDAFGKAAYRALREEGIALRYFVEKPGHPSGIALILVGGRTRENMIAVARSANDALTVEDVRAAEPVIQRARVVVAQLEVPLPAVLEAAQLARKHGATFVLNPAPAARLPQELWKLVDVLVPNEAEAAFLAGGKSGSPAELARRLQRRGVRNVVITLGAKGALVAEGAKQTTIAGLRVKPVDTVGAGDCFTAWLAAGLAEGADLVTAAHRATRAAAIAVTRPGAQAGMPYREELEESDQRPTPNFQRPTSK